jgi:3-oxoacyl-[acyl-carrier protein] reductase
MNDYTEKMAGKVAIITGGTGGIGAAVAQSVTRAGASAIVADVNSDRIDAVVRRLKELNIRGAEPIGVRSDVSQEGDNQNLARVALERFGRIDALVACAGILRGPGQSPRPIMDVTLDEWNQVIQINLTGVFLSNRAVLPVMIKQRSGTIINVSSVQGLLGRAHDGPYCASKFGVIGLSQSIAEEVKSFGVRVTSIMPHAIDTPMWDQNGPIPRPGNALPPERVAELIMFMLAQPEDTILTGVVIAPVGARMRKKSAEEAKHVG